jgi:hypothetical protein
MVWNAAAGRVRRRGRQRPGPLDGEVSSAFLGRASTARNSSSVDAAAKVASTERQRGHASGARQLQV